MNFELHSASPCLASSVPAPWTFVFTTAHYSRTPSEKEDNVIAITITAFHQDFEGESSKSELTTLEEGDDLYPRCKLPRHERDVGQLINPPRDSPPDLFFALARRGTTWAAGVVVDPAMCVTERIHPSTHRHSTCHPIPFAHFEDHVGDPSYDDCDFCLDVADGFEAEFEFWKVFVDDGEDGLIGHAVSGLSGGSADEPGFDLVEGGIDVGAEGWGHGLGVCLGGACGGGGEGVLPVLEHGVCVCMGGGGDVSVCVYCVLCSVF